MKLSELKEQQKAIVDGLEGDSRFIGRITSIGLTPGCEVMEKQVKNINPAQVVCLQENC